MKSKILSHMYMFLKKCYYKILNTFFCKKRVLFISLGGKQYSDNPKAISEKLYKISPKTKQIWLFKDPEKMRELVPDYIKCVELNNRILLRYIMTSRIYIDNDYLVYQNFLTKFSKNKKQLYIQTWHGDRGLKKCFYNVKGFKPDEKFTLEKDGFCDYLLTGSKFAEKVVRKMFKYNGKLLTCGYPRNDCLINNNEEKIKSVKDKLDISYDTKILLYAPTFKGKIGDKMTEHINFSNLVDELEKKTKKKWVVVYRNHHMSKINEKNKSLRFFDATTLFEDMADILCASDILITDYSSCAGDFILTGKPVILYINDYYDYISSDRGLHFKIEETPYMIANNNEELIEIVRDLTPEKAKENCKKLMEFYECTETGEASEIVVELILNNLYHKKGNKYETYIKYSDTCL